MWSFLERLLDSSTFSPHGICLLWEPELIWLHVISDAIIAASYFSIPFALAILVSKRRDFQFGWMAWPFAAFILACGLTHVFSIYTLWVPIYGLEGLLKALTAVASIFTAVLLWPLIPLILAIPTEAQLREAHVALAEEERQRQRSEFLLERFREAEANESKIRQAQKMEAVGQLTGGIAPDFNNILTVITGTIDILAEAVTHNRQLTEITSLIRDAAERGASLTRHLLAFARKQPLQPSDVDVNALMVDTIELLRPTIGDHVDIDFHSAPDLPRALVDGNQLVTAIINLALNARDAMPKGGRLTIETRTAELKPSDVNGHDGLAAGDYVAIALTDNGRGIAEADLAKVFEPFFTTKDVGKGTGLGLSMVYGFVRQSNGHVVLDSEVGRGTRVMLYLPRAAVVSPAAVPERRQPDARGAREIVLVVEDDKLVRSYVLTQIESLGYTTLSANDGREALAVLDSGAPIDLLFTDVIMPGAMNGRDLATEARKRRPSLRVLFTSGYTDDAIDQDGKLEQGILFLAKPYSRAELARMLRVALREDEAVIAQEPAA
ncbi:MULTISPECIES: ATP-binding protein [Bradyrhizobium]|jgi:signal transduction histidine kinase/CheY-like chemotaxis protein|uniref:ATP-binding protein n=1 Tax=Bradyrhizobium TaxID=374 RepID=UPI0004BB67E6|nr:MULTISPECIES: ATP-binding protein [Bradyrhizobium]MCS3446748.1 signal transduction histidine kinase/CheY-like chemotaxis protein [Bradyrhizobium elkanii]MCS3562118.1 signal transduction histidine kinase/CheY-like chemotaxis protein [Bradyrhizobium elkanii]MCW2148044.1 signal transduction histidine kinase/CheY-like chemotaxis protein [Bradyrhizobium elkanii]MCW2352872.1 signal transduction histidine kinase/CheY-like chemotaxis protein [Bradyrhizobium elkanii]MCW2371770.1 signal transduction 